MQARTSFFTVATGACGAGRQWQQALALHGRLRASGLEPHVSNCVAGISVCGKCGQWQQAMLMFREIGKAM
eukprot:4449994-Pyramimonas_sp.AAC.1